MQNITHIEKDIVLKWLCTNTEYRSSDILSVIDFDTLNFILSYFVRKGLIYDNDIRRSQTNYHILPCLEAFDLYNHGGYTGIEFLLESNLHKLQLELEQLQSHLPEKTNMITGIISAVTGALALFIR